jgi:hypothetical protein
MAVSCYCKNLRFIPVFLLQRYLEKFNHLGAYNPDPRMANLRASNPDEEFKLAVSSFQRFAGLNMTGLCSTNSVNRFEGNVLGEK